MAASLLRLKPLLRPALAATGAAAAAAAAISAPPRCEEAPKRVTTLTLRVDPSIEGDVAFWLPASLKKLLEMPGMLGAKVLKPLSAPAAAAAAEPAADEAAKPGVIFVLGGPGAGKGTQCGKMVEKYGYVHLSAGDLLRAERKSGSDVGDMIEEYIREGKIVPVEITVGLILKAIEADGGGRFLVDGFPRNANNLSGWHAVASASLNVGGVLQYDCPEEVMEARLIERGKTSGRVDDNVESIRKRFAVFERETMPVLQYYEYLGLVHKVDGTRPVDEVWVDTQAAVEAIEGRLAAAAAAAAAAAPTGAPPSDDRAEWRVHVYGSGADASLAPDAARHLAAEAAARWGAGAVDVVDEGTSVCEVSLKAFDLDALRSFD